MLKPKWRIDGERIMKPLSNEHLLETYRIAMELNLEEAFIQLLLKEMDRRGLKKPS